MTEIIAFHSAISETHRERRNLLLGNGFSIACRPTLFAYGELFSRAPEHLSETATASFDALTSTDFEFVMKALDQTNILVNAFDPENRDLQDKLLHDVQNIREALVKVIAENHPFRVDRITDAEYRFCRAFVHNFNTIFTLIYDLLLYWAINRQHIDDLTLNLFDGFTPSIVEEESGLFWDFGGMTPQNVFHLHGGLHLFDAGSSVRKMAFNATGIPLVEQVRQALENGLHPIYVAEGEADEKMARILRNAYLSDAFANLAKVSGTMFVFGHSFKENDDHILYRIADCNVDTLYVSIYGDPRHELNVELIQRAEDLSNEREYRREKKKRRQRRPEWEEWPTLDVKFFDAESAEIWHQKSRFV